MAYKKKSWVNRQSEYPNRRGLRAVAGQSNVYDITREEGLVVEEGDPFDQVSMNALEGRVADAFAEITGGAVKAGKAVVADSALACTGNAATATRATSAATADKATNATNAANATRAVTAATADNANKVYGKAEGALNVNYANSAGSASAIAWGNVSGKPSTYTPAAHNQAAGTITAGTLPTGVLATNAGDHGTSRLRNAYFATGRPGQMADGTICFVY